MDKIDQIERNLGTWRFLRTGWWVLHIAAIALIFWLGMYFGGAY